jgi:DNA polymerase-3 subunit gamma/tau
MAYRILARKYRPQRFSHVVGQEHVTRTLLNALEQGRTAHGYIFSGHRGIGKTTIARILAMALNCRTAIGSSERPTAEPCGTCVSCEEIRNGNSVDMLEIDAATNRGIDEIRELRDAARYSPARDRYKIYLFDEAHQITDAAFNALLKTLEEPPDHVVFMMATTQPEDIPQTIRSRCQHFSFHAVKFNDIMDQLRQIAGQEKIAADDEALALLAEAGDGSMRDALSIMDQAIASAPLVDGSAKLETEQIRELMGTAPSPVFEQLMGSVHAAESAAVIERINRLIDAGNSPLQLARQIVRYLRNSLMAKLGGESTELLQISSDERARAARTAALFSEEDLTRFLQVMLRTFDDLNYRQEQRFHLELGLIKLVHLERLIPLEQILSSLPDASGSSGTPGPGSRPPAGGRRASAVGAAHGLNAAATANAPAVRDSSPPALASPPQPVAEPEQEQPSQPAPSPSLPAELEAVRQAIVAALEQANHATAAGLLSCAHWSVEPEGGIRVEAGMKKTMLGLTINAEASKIVRDALRATGSAQAIAIVPAEPRVDSMDGLTATPAAAPPFIAPRGGGIQAIALENPLVRQAQEIFRAEVRNVLDLRESSQPSSRGKR